MKAAFMVRHKVLYTRVANERFQELQRLAAVLGQSMSALVADAVELHMAAIRAAAERAKEERAAA